MPKQVQPVPQGYHSVTPFLVVNDAAAAIDFYRRAFGAKETMRMEGPGGKIAHAELKIGDSMIMLSDEMPGSNCKPPKALGGTSVNVFLYLERVDTVFNQAVSAGAKVHMPLTDMFWGDRFGSLNDPFGHSWSLATHIEDVPLEEIRKRGQKAMSEMSHREPQPVG